MQQLAFAVFNGLATGMGIFLVALGLTWMFGIMRMLNLAHGAFMMIGAYVAFTLVGRDPASLPLLLGASLAAGCVVTALGFVVDRVLFSRLRDADPHYVLIATFALLMLCEGLVKLVWGEGVISVNPPPELAEPVVLPGLIVSRYTVFVIVTGVLVFGVVDSVLNRLWLSKLMRALATDAWMCGLMGVNVTRGLMISVMVSFFSAGVAGGLLLANQSLSPQLGESVLLTAFFAVVIGGLGSIRGAFAASVLLGLADSLNGVILPDYPGLAMYVVLAVFLVLRPNGLVPAIGTMVEHVRSRVHAPQLASRYWLWPIAAAAAVLLVTAPLWAGQGLLFIIGLTLIQALLALSWNLLFGYAGLASFGHAGFFAIGAYTTGAVMLAAPGVPFGAVLLLAAALGAVTAGLTGLLALRRLAGVFLAVLTVALSEMLRLVFSYIPALGGEDGLSAIPRPRFSAWGVDLASGQGYYWMLLFVSVATALALRLLVGGKFGRALTAIRQDPERAAFLGIDVFRFRLAAFMISCGVAALSGALFAPWTRIVTLAEVGWLTSTQPILNSLLGGVGTFWGPVVGTFAYAALTYSTRTVVGLSEVLIGGSLLLIILLAPNGLLGLVDQAAARLPMRRTVRPAIGRS
jgi:branched-chain amino acid transport system permease protein